MIIGITGTNGAGKGTVVDYLVQHKGFVHGSARDLIREELVRRGLELNRDNTRLVANELRKMHGPGYIAEELLRRAQARGGNTVIESIRTVGEAEYLKSRGALIWAVDADRQTRYDRVVLRGSETDKISFEQFCAEEDREMAQTEKFDMNIKGVMQFADAILTNDGRPEDLYAQVEQALLPSKN